MRRDVLFDQRWRYNGSGVTITQLLEQERADRRMKAETTGSDCADPSGDPDDILDPIDSVDQGGPPHQGGFRNQGGQQLPAARGNLTKFFQPVAPSAPAGLSKAPALSSSTKKPPDPPAVPDVYNEPDCGAAPQDDVHTTYHLDLACGTGSCARSKLRKKNARVMGIDIFTPHEYERRYRQYFSDDEWSRFLDV